MDMHEDAVHMFEKVAIQLIAEGKEVHVHGTGPITEAAAGGRPIGGESRRWRR